MKIHKLTIDDKELKQAVQAYLATQGISCPVHSVSKPYSWSELEVTFEFEVESEHKLTHSAPPEEKIEVPA